MRYLVAVLVVATTAPVAGQDSSVVISGGPTTGAATVNIAAGNQNQQVNAAAIADGGLASSGLDASQHQGGPASLATSSATAVVADNAFAGSSGWIAVNGAAGSDNQQANLASIAFGIEVGTAADIALSQTRASTEPTGGPSGPVAPLDRQASISGSAFAGSNGLVQVSLIGGDRNTSANSFALTGIGDAAPPAQ